MGKCNCVAEIRESLIKASEAEDVMMPITLGGHVYIEVEKFYLDKKGKRKQKSVPVILSRCPFCGVLYPGQYGEAEEAQDHAD
jgi:hypothetical protein